MMKNPALIATCLAYASTAQADTPKGLFSLDDYPPEALARGEEGTVTVKLLISPEGRVIGCTVIKSATQALDAATCYVMMRRAKFKPGKSEAGIPTEDDYVQSITWKLDGQKENKDNNSTRMSN